MVNLQSYINFIEEHIKTCSLEVTENREVLELKVRVESNHERKHLATDLEIKEVDF